MLGLFLIGPTNIEQSSCVFIALIVNLLNQYVECNDIYEKKKTLLRCGITYLDNYLQAMSGYILLF